MDRLKKITPLQGLVMGAVVVIVIGIIIATQSYFSYLEVTQAAEGCFEKGGLPIIEKSGLTMTYFQCNMD